MSRLTLFQRRILAAVISLTSFVSSIPVLAAIGKDPLITALMIPLGIALAVGSAALGRRLMRLPRERRRRWLWSPAEAQEHETEPDAPQTPQA